MNPILRALILASPLLSLGEGLPQADRKAIAEELTAPVTLTLTNLQTISGHPINVSDTQLQIASTEDAGEIVFTFDHDEIEAIEIPGEGYKSLIMEWLEAGDHARALELMDLLYAQRKTLLPILPASESNFFVLYIPLILDSPDPARAIGVGARLGPQIENPAARRALDDAILESYQRLKLFDEAVTMAARWVEERKPYGESALGYFVLGSDHLRHADYETALDLALQPIVFSSLLPCDKLGHCYALGVAAAIELRDYESAVRLYREMQIRGLLWPESDSTLKPYLDTIKQHLARHEVD